MSSTARPGLFPRTYNAQSNDLRRSGGFCPYVRADSDNRWKSEARYAGDRNRFDLRGTKTVVARSAAGVTDRSGGVTGLPEQFASRWSSWLLRESSRTRLSIVMKFVNVCFELGGRWVNLFNCAVRLTRQRLSDGSHAVYDPIYGITIVTVQ